MSFLRDPKFITAFAVAAGVLLISCVVLYCFRSNEQKRSAPDFPVTSEAFRRVLLAHHRKYLEENRRLLRGFQDTFPEEVRRSFVPVEKCADELCGEMSSLKFCTVLCLDILKDASGSGEASSLRFQRLYARRLLPSVAAADGASLDRLRSFQHLLRENANRFCAGLVDLPAAETLEIDLPYRELTAGLQRFGAESAGFAIDKTLTYSGAALEIVFAGASVKAVRRLYSHIMLRWSKQLAAGAVCAVADGPLPAGDVAGAVLGIGGAVWTSWDLWQVTQILPGEMRSLLRKSIADHRLELLNKCMRQAEEMVLSQERESGIIVEKLLAGE